MNLVDIVVIAVLIGILALIFYFTRNKNGKHSGCAGCHDSCSSCSMYGNLFEEYKKDHPDSNKP